MLIAHEIAHQWFGDSATELEWKDIWLSEGFATYFALLFTEHARGVPKRQQEMMTDRNQVVGFHNKLQYPVVNPQVTDLMQLLNVNSYQKGSWVLHMLRQELGDEKFWMGIRDYYQKYQDKNATTTDFKNAMQRASGQDLTRFFTQWIDTPGHPVINVTWNYDENGKKLNLKVVQTQKGAIFAFPLEIGLAESEIKRLDIDKQIEEISLPMAKKPSNLTLDPNVNLLFEGKVGN